MSSFEAATAASTHARPQVLRRETLCDNHHIVEVAVPCDAATGCYENGKISVPFVIFSRGVKDGWVHLLVHTDDPSSCKGKTIVAQVLVKRKILTNKETYLYIDLFPAPGRLPTHRLTVMPGGKAQWERAGCRIFETPDPLQGVIIIGPLEMKFTSRPRKVPQRTKFSPKIPKTPGKNAVKTPRVSSSTDDPKLNRLVNVEGWTIKFWGPKNAIRLIRKVRGVLKEMTHYHQITKERR